MKDRQNRGPLRFGSRWLEGDSGPIHLIFGKVAAEIASHPKFQSRQSHCPELSAIDPEGAIKAAEALLAPAVICVPGGSGVEITLAKHRTATRLDDRRVQGPFCWSASRLSRQTMRAGGA